MKPYAVEVSFTMIVMAEDENEAQEVAEDNGHDGWSDAPKDFHVIGPVRTESDLNQHSWSLYDVPYGGDGDTCLQAILEEMEPEPERDTRTIDMFASQAS